MNSSFWRRYVPVITNKPFTLALKLLTERNPAARSALFMAVAGFLLSPVDHLWAGRERRTYRHSAAPTRPVILICGAPRSGTTLVSQYLINSLNVAYINNLSSLFPLSPITANRLLGRIAQSGTGSYFSYYGRSSGLAGANDGLQLWDRWLGAIRSTIPTALMQHAADNMKGYFGSLQLDSNLPVITKINRLVGCAELVAPVLPSSYFVLVTRDPVMLAQSLLLARSEISGSAGQPYGLTHTDSVHADPIEDVCLQVEYLQKLVVRLKNRINPNRLVVVDYDEFCKDPSRLVDSLFTLTRGQLTMRAETAYRSERFTASREIRIPEKQYWKLRDRLL